MKRKRINAFREWFLELHKDQIQSISQSRTPAKDKRIFLQQLIQWQKLKRRSY